MISRLLHSHHRGLLRWHLLVLRVLLFQHIFLLDRSWNINRRRGRVIWEEIILLTHISILLPTMVVYQSFGVRHKLLLNVL